MLAIIWAGWFYGYEVKHQMAQENEAKGDKRSNPYSGYNS